MKESRIKVRLEGSEHHRHQPAVLAFLAVYRVQFASFSLLLFPIARARARARAGSGTVYCPSSFAFSSAASIARDVRRC